MFRIYDVQCEKCGFVEEQFIEDEKFEPCSKCKGKVKRIYSTFNFKLEYNNKKDTVGWSSSGYSTSKYWDEINKAKSEGKNVRPQDEK